MIKIHKIYAYRDGGSISILITNVEPMLLDSLGLPNNPKYPEGQGNTESVYEIWRSYKIGDKNKGSYYWGDINGDYIEIDESHVMMVKIKELLEYEREGRVYFIDKFLVDE